MKLSNRGGDRGLTIEDLTADEVRLFVMACEIDNSGRTFEPSPEDLSTCERLRELGILQRRMITVGSVAYDLSPAGRTADRLCRLTETARASTN